MQTIILDLSLEEQEIEVTEDCEILGLYEGNGQDKLKSKLTVIHRKPGLNSRVNVKAVLQGESQFDLEAKIVIEKGARLTDTYLKLSALTLSELARARAVPSLEIMEDEVKGGHGATIGKLDERQVYYLTSRGISGQLAQELLVESFISEIKAKIENATQ